MSAKYILFKLMPVLAMWVPPANIASLPAFIRRIKSVRNFVIVKQHLIPRFVFSLQWPRVTRKILKRVDGMIRKTVKKILHMSEQTPNSFFYAPLREGAEYIQHV